jgi:uncharacterized membrane protein
MDVFGTGGSQMHLSVWQQFNASARSGEDFEKLFSLTLMHESNSLSGTIVFNTLVSIAYIVFCAVVFIFSLIEMLTGIFVSPAAKGASERYSRKFRSGALFALLILPLVLMSNLYACNFGRNDALVPFKAIGLGASVGFYLSLILLLAINLLLIAGEPRNIPEALRGLAKSVRVRDAITLICILFVMMASFLPLLSVTVSKSEGGRIREDHLNAAASDLGEVSNDLVRYYKSLDDEELADGLLDLMNNELSHYESVSTAMSSALFRRYSGATRTMYSLAHVLVLLSLFMSAKILYSHINGMLNGQKQIKKQTAAKVILTIISTALLLLCIVIASSVTGADTSFYLSGADYAVSAEAGIAPLLALMSMIVAFFAMGGNKKEVKRLSPYDNPDISYAPYVLK